MNVYIETDGTFPEGLTESEKILRLLNFWKRWDPAFRKVIIEMHIKRSHMFCHADGVIEGVLKGLEQIDHKRLHDELEKAGLTRTVPQDEQKSEEDNEEAE